MFVEDTIAAISTSLGAAAIAVLRVSGPQAVPICDRLFATRNLSRAEARRAYFGQIVAPDGQAIDDVLVTVFAKPHSYTGEDLVEISCHGGVLVTREIYQLLLGGGCRAAEPGEFTQRAFLNGKLDLTQAEAVMDLIVAQTPLALRAANAQLHGGIGKAMESLREKLIAITAHLEAFIDFPDEDIDPDSTEALVTRLQSCCDAMDELLAGANQGRILREGARAVICGSPNVGKSSLLNLLLGFDRAMVSEIAGTTRDTVEEVINLRGIPLRIIDTAGVREAGDALEREGIVRTIDAIQRADVVIEVVDGHRSEIPPPVPGLEDSLAQVIRLLNKADLGLASEQVNRGGIPFSCKERSGLNSLMDAIETALSDGGGDWQSRTVAINARHQACLIRAREACDRSIKGLTENLAPEFVASDLREALEAVGEVVGKVDAEEILGEIFSSFCIGK